MQNTEMSLKKVSRLFSQLPAVEGSMPTGDYRAEMTGPLWLRKSSGALLSGIGFSNWYGKRIFDNEQAINLRDGGAQLLEFLPMMLTTEVSRLDNKAAWLLRYPQSTHFPVRHMADELRPLNSHTLLGISYTELPGLKKLGLPFLLHKQF